ncbi:MAG: hypothetical protein IRY97_02715, partial [Thermomicrobiaceae bacterium]|nr:hypothetical protein [Thermomicrobiaceae bacterium]
MDREDERAMPEPESPRLRALQRQVAADGEVAVEAFWAERAREGTPLIEPAG